VVKTFSSLNVFLGSRPVGRIALTPKRLVVFEYDPEFLVSGFSISPLYLPLRSGLFTASLEPFDGNFGVFNDSLPDGWGNLLMDRYFASQGIQLQALSVLDRLSLVGSAGMGALEYFPDHHIQFDEDNTDISFLAGEVAKVISETQYSDHLKLLVDKNGSSGGARPKVLISEGASSWIVKFPSSLDPPGIGRIEHNYSIVARKCGIEMPRTKLFEDQYFATERFDRIGNKRIHMISASGLLNASHRYPSLDYTEIIKASFALTRDIENSYRLFRLMIFNVLTGNKDDHAKNFSFLHSDEGWRLSPAYDLVPSPGFNGNHTTTVAGEGQPLKKDIFEVGQRTGLDKRKMTHIFEEVYENCASIRLDN